MTLTDLASWGSLLSSIAVLISLIFVGLQIRQANRNQRSAMQQGRSDRNVKLLSRLTDPKLSEMLPNILKQYIAEETAGIAKSEHDRDQS